MVHAGTRIIDTPRLLLRPFLFTDRDDMVTNWISNPKVQMEYGEPVYKTKEEVTQLLEQWVGQYGNLEFYRWAIIEKQSNQNIGQIAFCKVYPEIATAEMEYCIGEKYWGNGYAGEALSAVIDYAFMNTGFAKLEAFHREANDKSGRVLQKSSMGITENVERFRRMNQHPHGEVCYAITRDDYFAK